MDRTVSMTPGQQDDHPSRREFLTRAGLMAGGMAVLGLSGIKSHPAAALETTRSYTGTFALELDKETVPIRSAEGGFPRADVISEMVGPGYVTKKHIGPPKFQPMVIGCDPLMSKTLFDWIAATLTMNLMKKSGALITANFDLKEHSRLQFTNALITEIGFPACEGASKDAGFLTVKLAPEFTTPLAGKGSVVPITSKTTQRWLLANFRLTIPGLDCSKVSKIDAFTIKQTMTENVAGVTRDYAKEPPKLEFPNLSISLAESTAATFYAWFQDMVIKGNTGENNEKAGILEFLDPTLKSTIMTVYLHHLGIFGFAPEKTKETDAIKRVKVDMYCEQITLTSKV